MYGQFNLFDYLDEQYEVRNVLAEEPLMLVPTLENVEEEITHDVRHEAQANRKIAYDVGEKIGGSRKDLAALRKMFMENPTMENFKNVFQEDEIAADELITRDVFFDWFSLEVCYQNQVDFHAAYAMHLMIRRLPKDAYGLLNKQAYVAALDLISDEMKRVKTFKEFDLMFSRFSTMASCVPSVVTSYERRKKLILDKFDPTDNQEIVRNKKEKVMYYDASLHLTERYDTYRLDQLGRFYELISSNKKIRSFNTSINKFTSWDSYLLTHPFKQGNGTKGKTIKGTRSNKPVWERVLPQQPTHNSPFTLEAFKSPEAFRQYFNFRAVEYGNYVNDEMGFKHMNNCASGYVDLSHLLGIPHEKVSLGNQLAMAFGARGKGRALGHFERGYNVINLTRDKGSLGILAHEWFHAYDRFLKRTQSTVDDGGLVTEGMNNDLLPSDITDACNMLIDTMKFGRSKAFVDVSKCKTIYTIRNSFIEIYEQFEGDLQSVMDYYLKRFDDYTEERAKGFYSFNYEKTWREKRERKRKTELKKIAEGLSQYHLKVTGEKVTMIAYTSDKTRFFNIALTLDRGKEGKYWSSVPELAARAFEYYINELLKEKGWRNDYLVCGLDEIYPTGEEGKRIREAMALFMEATLPYLTRN